MTPAHLNDRLNWLRRRLAEISLKREMADPVAVRLCCKRAGERA